REAAMALRREIDGGADPLGQRDEARGAARISELIERYIEIHLPNLAKRNADDQTAVLRKIIAPEWGKKLVTEITPIDVDRLLAKIAEGRARPAKAKPKTKHRKPLQPPRPTPIRANRVGEMLRKMFNLAIAWKMRADNPANGFTCRVETERERFLTMTEIDRLADVLARAEDQRAAAILRMCLLTGARVGEVRQARFEQFNLELLTWTKPASTTKQRKIHRLPISPEVATIVRQRRLLAGDGCNWLFPGDVAEKDQPVQEIRRFWKLVQAQADLPGVRIHDLRHTFASLLVSGGASLEIIGKLLGHSQMRTTQRYAHLADSPLRASVNAVAGIFAPRPRLVSAMPEAHARPA
ncbi:MAG: site-specific integrase, partial [Paracoccus sp. (in: a-proteobacteria)]|nr:site-specific integrase [Paracoccus sp. (in: a-proteobacteria)]